MQINKSAAISTPGVLLVPYEEKHVPVYHQWMQDPEIQQATASEPLSTEQEHEMQRTWRTDRDKLTFIICRPLHSYADGLRVEEHDSASNMLGDVNVFFSESVDDTNAIVGEIELMVAVKSCRRQGFGKASLLAMIQYLGSHEDEIIAEFDESLIQHTKGMTHLKVKIGKSNINSIRFFESLGFRKLSEDADFFGEFELRLSWIDRRSHCTELERFEHQSYAEVPYVAGN